MNEHMSAERYREELSVLSHRSLKYGNKREAVDGYTFASGVEAERYRPPYNAL